MIRFRGAMPDRSQLRELMARESVDLIGFFGQEIEVVLNGPAVEIGALLRGARVKEMATDGPAKDGKISGTITLL